MQASDESRRDIVVSIRPRYASKIIDGSKTVELRRRFPETLDWNTVIVIYASSPIRAIVGVAWVKEIKRLPVKQLWKQFGQAACIAKDDFDTYFSGIAYGYAIVLDHVRRLREQMHATELAKRFGFVPPQSFCYLGKEYDFLLRNEQLQIPC
jgi:predicted transcriptional regulator